MRFVPRTDFMGKGQSQLDVSLQVINDVRRDPKNLSLPANLFEDQETQRLSFLYSRGIAQGTEFSIEVPFLARDGGFMDPIISWWHHTILPPQDRVRNHLPFGKCVVYIPGVGTFASADGVGDVSVFLRKRLTPKLIFAAGVKAPTGNAAELLGSGAFDGGVNLEFRTKVFPKLQLDATLGAVAQGRATVLRHSRGFVDQESLALTYLRNSRDSWTVQWQSEASPTVIGLASNDEAHRMLTFGYQRKLSSRERLDLYFCEDRDLLPGMPMIVNIAPDFTVGVRIVKRL